MDSQSPPGRDAIENLVDRLLTKTLGHPIPSLKQRLKPPLTQLSHDLLLLDRRCGECGNTVEIEATFGMLVEGLREGLCVLEDVLNGHVASDDVVEVQEMELISKMLLHYASTIRWFGTAIQQNFILTAGSCRTYLSSIRDRFFEGVSLKMLLSDEQPPSEPRNINESDDDDDGYEYGHFLRRLFQGNESREMPIFERIGQKDVWRINRTIYWLDSADSNLRQLGQQLNTPDNSLKPEVQILVDLMKSTWLILKVWEQEEDLPDVLCSLTSLLSHELSQAIQQLYQNGPVDCNHVFMFDALSRSFNIAMPWEGQLEKSIPPAPPPYSSEGDLDTFSNIREKDSRQQEPIPQTNIVRPTFQEILPISPPPISTSQLSNNNRVNIRRGSEDAPIVAFTPDQDRPSTGLHVTHIENPSSGQLLVASLEDEQSMVQHPNSVAKASETEVGNTEYGDNWFTDLETMQLDQTESWIKSRAKIFKSNIPGQKPTFRVWIERENKEPLEVNFPINGTELIPTYAFSSMIQTNNAGQLHLRGNGDDERQLMDLQYRFDISQPEDTQLYSFQAGLLNSFFEGEFPVKGVMFYRKTNLEDYAFMTSFQIWTEGEFPETLDTSPTTLGSLNPLSRRHTSFDVHHNKIPAVKIFFFMENAINVLFISDLIELRRSYKPLSDNTRSSTITLVPKTKENVRYLRIRKLSGSKDDRPGIPLGGEGIRYEDQVKDHLFRNYDSVEIDFQSDEDCDHFQKEFQWHLQQWKNRSEELELHKTWLQIDTMYAIGKVTNNA